MVGEMKKRLQRKGARRGFTLVELLIVIIIIGILAGAMMMVAGGGRDAAEASKIISDLRNMKSAAIMWMAENPAGDIKTMWDGLNTEPAPLNSYLDRPLIPGAHKFIFEEEGTITKSVMTDPGEPNADPPVPPTYETTTIGGALLLGYDLAGVRDGVKENLEKQAQSAGLYGDTTIDLTGADPSGVGFYTKDKNKVYVIVQ